MIKYFNENLLHMSGMHKIKCDVLVVGAGPAGLSAARAAAKEGVKTLVIEEHPEIGKPVQCAEGIGEYLLQFLPFRVHRDLLRWKIEGMVFWARDMMVKREGKLWSGYTIDREKWDKWLASLAVKEGAAIKTASRLIYMDFQDDFVVKKVIVEGKDGNRLEIDPKVIIAADGVNSTVIDLLGVGESYIENVVKVKSFEVKNVRLLHPYHEQIFIGDFAPNAYAYIFPISRDRANVGVGVYKSGKKPEDAYQEFLELPIVKEQLKRAINVIEKSGDAPLGYRTKRWFYGNILLVGDAANQNLKPFVEGILPSMICGNIAGKLSADVAKGKGDTSDYPFLVNKSIRPLLRSSDKVLNILHEILRNENKDILNLLLGTNICSLRTIRKMLNERNDVSIRVSSFINNRYRLWATHQLEKLYLAYLFFWRIIRSVL